jgi:hypothetical protein
LRARKISTSHVPLSLSKYKIIFLAIRGRFAFAAVGPLSASTEPRYEFVAFGVSPAQDGTTPDAMMSPTPEW